MDVGCAYSSSSATAKQVHMPGSVSAFRLGGWRCHMVAVVVMAHPLQRHLAAIAIVGEGCGRRRKVGIFEVRGERARALGGGRLLACKGKDTAHG